LSIAYQGSNDESVSAPFSNFSEIGRDKVGKNCICFAGDHIRNSSLSWAAHRSGNPLDTSIKKGAGTSMEWVARYMVLPSSQKHLGKSFYRDHIGILPTPSKHLTVQNN
jgi:hypothetical protein